MQSVLQAIEEITLQCQDLLCKLLPYQQASDISDIVDDIYDKLEVNTFVEYYKLTHLL